MWTHYSTSPHETHNTGDTERRLARCQYDYQDRMDSRQILQRRHGVANSSNRHDPKRPSQIEARGLKMSQICINVSTFEPAPSDEIVAADCSFATNQQVVSGFDCGMSNGCTSLGRTWISLHDTKSGGVDTTWPMQLAAG